MTSDGRRKRQTQLCEIKIMKTFVVKVKNKGNDGRLKKYRMFKQSFFITQKFENLIDFHEQSTILHLELSC